MAHDLGIPYRFVEVKPDTSLACIAGEADVALRPYPMNEETESVVDFTDAYFHTGLAMQVLPGGKSITRLMRQSVFSWPVLSVVGLVALLVMGAGFLIWFLERRKNASFAGSGWKGVGSGLWWSSVTVTGVGYGDKIPHTFAGRSVAVALMFASLVVTSIFTATIISVVTVKNIQDGSSLRGDLGKLRVAVVAGSAGDEFAAAGHLRRTVFPSVFEAQSALLRGQCDVLIHNEAILRYLAREDADSPLVVLPEILAPSNFSIALREGSPWREALNRQLLRIVRSAAWTESEAVYLGPM